MRQPQQVSPRSAQSQAPSYQNWMICLFCPRPKMAYSPVCDEAAAIWPEKWPPATSDGTRPKSIESHPPSYQSWKTCSKRLVSLAVPKMSYRPRPHDAAAIWTGRSPPSALRGIVTDSPQCHLPSNQNGWTLWSWSTPKMPYRSEPDEAAVIVPAKLFAFTFDGIAPKSAHCQAPLYQS